MKEKELQVILGNHKEWLNDKTTGKKANLSGADLREADLSWANLSGANLRGANLDFSCLPLWCGGKFKADEKICKQLVAHTVKIMELSEIDKPELIKMMNKYKSGWHRENEF